jgi:hypothetical protein
MRWVHYEPTLDQILSDPIVKALMEADGVDPDELAAMLARIGWRSRGFRSGDGPDSPAVSIECSAQRDRPLNVCG